MLQKNDEFRALFLKRFLIRTIKLEIIDVMYFHSGTWYILRYYNAISLQQTNCSRFKTNILQALNKFYHSKTLVQDLLISLSINARETVGITYVFGTQI